MSTLLVGDCASDPPLSATARTLAVHRAADVVYGLGMVAVARGYHRLALAVRDADARAALAAACEAGGARVELIVRPPAWPTLIAGAEVVDARVLVASAEAARGLPVRCYVTVAGAVARPIVIAAGEGDTVASLVERAGGAEADDWVPVAGGAPAGRLVERGATAGELDGMVLVLPAGHEVVRRLRTPVADWLLRAASACEGCRMCSEACPTLAPHELVWTLATLRDDGVAPAAALACIGCGLCDAMCPAALSPRALVTEVRDRLVRLGAQTKIMSLPGPRARLTAQGSAGFRDSSPGGIDVRLLTARLGLGAYEKAVGVGVQVRSGVRKVGQ